MRGGTASERTHRLARCRNAPVPAGSIGSSLIEQASRIQEIPEARLKQAPQVTLAMTDPFMDAAVVDEPRPNGFREESLAPVYELNELFIETLAEAERHPTWAGSGWQDAL